MAMMTPMVATPSFSEGGSSPSRAARWSDVMDESDDECSATAAAKDSESDSCSTRSGDGTVPSDDGSVSELEVQTTLRLTSLPTGFSRSQLVALLEEEGIGGFDFIYLPADFKKQGSCFGYAFVNFDSEESALLAQSTLADRFEASWAVTQGLESHIERFRNSSVMHSKVPDEAKPALFRAGIRIPFPAPTKRIAAPRVKSST